MIKIFKQEVKRLFPILEAIKKGKTIQFHFPDGWRDIDGDDEGFYLETLIGESDKYRIKPEPKYRSFKNAEECLAEMLKHQPFGWIKGKEDEYHTFITTVDNNDDMSLSGNSGWSFIGIMNNYTFADGVPFGVKIE